MAEEKKTETKKPEKKPETKTEKKPTPKAKVAPVAKNGKGDGPRNIFSEEFRSNFDSIDWSK
ncbi:MAG: hypothetical protein OSB19_11375 [Opitutaceae bacterium]|nr:hypothetical protein [Opitutaceae bacterium]